MLGACGSSAGDGSEETSELPQMTVEELAIIASEDELELLEELEFYIWYDKDKNI